MNAVEVHFIVLFNKLNPIMLLSRFLTFKLFRCKDKNYL